jgi:pimeloyl-ACP methyl ester carboxylesterase
VTGFTTSESREAFDRLDVFIRDHGPFDGVVGFSLGASLAMGYMLHHRRKNPDGAPPFSFAVLFSPSFICSPDNNCYADLIRRLLGDEYSAFRLAFPGADAVSLLKQEDERTFVGYLTAAMSLQASLDGILPITRFDFFTGDHHDGGERPGTQNIPRLLHPALVPERVAIPTLHVTGKQEVPTMAEQSAIARGLCIASLARIYTHGGGHDVPFKRSDVTAIVSSIRAAAEEGRRLREVYY